MVINGFKMMPGIPFTLLEAARFGNILHTSKDISGLVNRLAHHVGGNRILA
jgi:predicted histidine transporter YuiF (NhaC family)